MNLISQIAFNMKLQLQLLRVVARLTVRCATGRLADPAIAHWMLNPNDSLAGNNKASPDLQALFDRYIQKDVLMSHISGQ